MPDIDYSINRIATGKRFKYDNTRFVIEYRYYQSIDKYYMIGEIVTRAGQYITWPDTFSSVDSANKEIERVINKRSL